MNPNMGGDMSKKVCNCPHHKVVPIMIIIIGLVILVGAFSMLTFQWASILIGVALIVIGGTKLGSRSCKCCSK